MYRQVIFNNVMLTIQYVANGLIPLLLIPHIVRNIGLNSYGRIAILLSLANYAAVVVQYAFQLTGPKQLAHRPSGKSAKAVFWEITGAKLILLGGVIIAFAATFPFVTATGLKETKLLWFFLLLPVGTALNSSWFLQSIERFLVVSATSIIAASVALAIGFGMVSADTMFCVTAATVSLVTGAFITGLGTFLAAWWHLRHDQGKFDWRASVCALRDSGSVFISQFTAALYALSGPLIIGLLVSTRAAGAYSAVERITGAVIGVCSLTHTAAYPKLATLYHDQRQRYWKLMRFVIAAYFACVLPILAISLLSGDALERFLFGSATTGQDALIRWGMVWVSLGIFGAAFTGYLTVSGRQNRVLPLTAKVLTASLMLGIPGVIWFGPWAWLASLAISQSLVLLEGYVTLKNDSLESGQGDALLQSDL